MSSRLVTYSTKAQQVERYLRESIRTGVWASGQRLPTESELMSEMEVSRSTLREALNFLYKDGLITRKQGLGTFVSTDVKTGTIVMVVKSTEISGMMGYWARRMAEEAKRLIEGAGYRFVMLVAQGQTDEERSASVNVFDGRTPGDIVGAIVTMGLAPLVQMLDRMGICVVSTGSRPLEGCCPYHVFWDFEEFIEISIGLLKQHGHNDFAVMHVSPGASCVEGLSWGASETDDHCNMVRALQRTCDVSLDRLVPVPYTLNYEYAYDAFTEWWSKPNRPSAMYFTDDALFDVASRAMLALGIDVPEDLAVITLANVGRQFHFPVGLTRVGWDPTDVMSAAWDMLHNLLTGAMVGQRIVGISPAILEDSSLEVKGGVRELDRVP